MKFQEEKPYIFNDDTIYWMHVLMVVINYTQAAEPGL